MVKNFIAGLVLVGITALPVLAAWPTFGKRSAEPTPPTTASSSATTAGSEKESTASLSRLWSWKSVSKPAPAIAPYYGALAPQPETTAQKMKRALNPTKWFSGSESKKVSEPDPISISSNDQPPTPQLRVAMAQMAEAKGKTEEARKLMEQALAEAPQDAMVLREFARLEDRAGRLAEAEKLYRRAVAANPNDPSFRNDLGLCLARSGKHRESAAMLQTAIELNPQKALYRNNLATVLVELGDTGGAFVQLSAVHPPAVAHYNMGQLFSQRGRHAEAAQCYQTALQIDPTLQPAQAGLARVQAGNLQVAARPGASPQATPASTPLPTPAATTLVTPEPGFGPGTGPSFPVPRHLPPVE